MKLERTVIQDESYLQKYIIDHPDVLPLDQLQESIRPLARHRVRVSLASAGGCAATARRATMGYAAQQMTMLLQPNAT